MDDAVPLNTVTSHSTQVVVKDQFGAPVKNKSNVNVTLFTLPFKG